jgi:hypothetical protein
MWDGTGQSEDVAGAHAGVVAISQLQSWDGAAMVERRRRSVMVNRGLL